MGRGHEDDFEGSAGLSFGPGKDYKCAGHSSHTQDLRRRRTEHFRVCKTSHRLALLQGGTRSYQSMSVPWDCPVSGLNTGNNKFISIDDSAGIRNDPISGSPKVTEGPQRDFHEGEMCPAVQNAASGRCLL